VPGLDLRDSLVTGPGMTTADQNPFESCDVLLSLGRWRTSSCDCRAGRKLRGLCSSLRSLPGGLGGPAREEVTGVRHRLQVRLTPADIASES
jgi:hypothetical protein